MSDDNRFVDRRTVLGTLGAGFVGLSGCMGDDEGDGNGAGDGDGGNGDTDGDSDGNGGGGDTDTPTDGNGGGGASLSVTGVWADAEQEDFQAVVDYVEGETGHEIEYQPRTTEDLLTGTLMDYQSEVAPADIVVMPSPARIRTDARNGHLEPVGDTWNPDGYAVEPERISVDGDVYAAPFKMDLKPGFWYRQSFFEDNDLEEPGSYDEFLDLLDEISGIDGVDAPIASGNGDGWPLSDFTEGFIMRQEDGAQFQQDLLTGDASFTDDRMRTALEEIKDLHERGHFSELREFGVQYEYFWENSLPLYFMGSFTPAQEAVQDPSDLGVFRLPGVDGITSSVNWFTVPTYSENVDAAKEAVEGIVSPEGQQVWAERGGFIASSTEVPEDAYELEIMAQLPDMADEVTIVPDLDDGLGDPFQSEFWSQLTGLWADPQSEIDPILSALDDAQQQSLQEEDSDS